ncbi:MAG: alpha/beta hydrolase [Chloroflexi bacterium]|nr:MAG: alpha/beta hydrolase [Chloroflexota bacterium]MBL1193215.1 alpha/beta hydrolase [Chloroflexota bacterium]NOH10509.1 alpha/beta hydrolase [Chloroflexota bacterium]
MTEELQKDTPLTTQQAVELWYTVPKRQPTDRERHVLETADNSTIEFGEVNLAVSSWGTEGPLVLLMHGWGGNRGQLSYFVNPLLAAGYRVVAFDAPAHGATPGEQTNGFEMAQAMLRVIEEIGQPYAVIAHSLGTLAATVALQQGLQVEKLVYSGAMRRLSDALEAFMHMNTFTEETRDAILADVLTRFGDDVWELTSLDKQLPKFDIPALLFHDRKDEITPYISSVAIARAWPSAKLISTDGLGHRRILQDEEVIRQVVEFLVS